VKTNRSDKLSLVGFKKIRLVLRLNFYCKGWYCQTYILVL